tara:strand:- start:677 stop:943 length:267 start_codon:yes stop_codon:yes gene_type:complete
MSTKDLKIIEIPDYSGDKSSLYVISTGNQVEFDIQRVFTIKGSKGAARGGHAYELLNTNLDELGFEFKGDLIQGVGETISLPRASNSK